MDQLIFIIHMAIQTIKLGVFMQYLKTEIFYHVTYQQHDVKIRQTL